jgi:multimeric flavodoxin WrbA
VKIVAICGSPRGSRSQTRALTEAVLEGARAKGAEAVCVDLGRVRLGFCRACEACHQGPECALNDDGRPILQDLLAADGFVLASPVYLNQVTAQLKALLDRTSHFVHCLRLTGKYAAAVTTSGGGGGTEVVAYLKNYALTVGAQFVGGVDARAPLKEPDLAAGRDLGAALATAIREKKTDPEQLRVIEERKAYFRRVIAFHEEQWPFEHHYWQNMGWL